MVSFVIKDHGAQCASGFADHTAIANYKSAIKYQEAAPRLGFQLLTTQELEELRSDYEAAIAKHGPPFKGDYGWAAKFLNNPSPRFVDLERAVNLGHMRPFYGMASDNVHAGPRSLLAKLGTFREDLLLMGPSPLGLADPGQETALSLSMLIATRMTLHPVMDTILLARVAGMLAVRARDQFISTQEHLQEVSPEERPGVE